MNKEKQEVENSFLPKDYKCARSITTPKVDWREAYCEKVADQQMKWGEERGIRK
jgi:hypothetical protein